MRSKKNKDFLFVCLFFFFQRLGKGNVEEKIVNVSGECGSEKVERRRRKKIASFLVASLSCKDVFLLQIPSVFAQRFGKLNFTEQLMSVRVPYPR